MAVQADTVETSAGREETRSYTAGVRQPQKPASERPERSNMEDRKAALAGFPRSESVRAHALDAQGDNKLFLNREFYFMKVKMAGINAAWQRKLLKTKHSLLLPIFRHLLSL